MTQWLHLDAAARLLGLSERQTRRLATTDAWQKQRDGHAMTYALDDIRTTRRRRTP